MEIHVLEIEGGMPNALEMLRAMAQVERAKKARVVAEIEWLMCRELVRMFPGDKLLPECAKLVQLEGAPKELTAEVFAERARKVAALETSYEVTDDGDLYLATIMDPHGTGEVWCKFPLNDIARDGMKKAKLMLRETTNKRPA